MKTKWIVGCALLSLIWTAGARGQEDDSIPDKAATRQQIDQMIQQTQAKNEPARLGMCLESMDLSISFGAPTWNAGDHAGCRDFYKKTAQSLCAAFGSPGAATPAAARTIHDLKNALSRLENSTDVDGDAWTLRYAFDKAQVYAKAESDRGEGLVALGEQYLQRGSLREAEDAYGDATDALKELDHLPVEGLSTALRFAPLGMANVQVAQRKYEEAVTSIERGLELLPEWPKASADFHNVYGEAKNFNGIMTDLTAAAGKSPNDASLQFLLGYEYYFSGSQDLAREQFIKALAIDPNQAGATAFLKQLNAAGPPAAGTVPEQNPSQGAPADGRL